MVDAVRYAGHSPPARFLYSMAFYSATVNVSTSAGQPATGAFVVGCTCREGPCIPWDRIYTCLPCGIHMVYIHTKGRPRPECCTFLNGGNCQPTRTVQQHYPAAADTVKLLVELWPSTSPLALRQHPCLHAGQALRCCTILPDVCLSSLPASGASRGCEAGAWPAEVLLHSMRCMIAQEASRG